MGIPVILSIGIGYAIKHFITENTWLTLIINGTLIVFAYIVFVGILGTSTREKKMAIKKIKNILKINKKEV